MAAHVFSFPFFFLMSTYAVIEIGQLFFISWRKFTPCLWQVFRCVRRDRLALRFHVQVVHELINNNYQLIALSAVVLTDSDMNTHLSPVCPSFLSGGGGHVSENVNTHTLTFCVIHGLPKRNAELLDIVKQWLREWSAFFYFGGCPGCHMPPFCFFIKLNKI